MKIVICYFSGTGNTRKIADKYAEYLRCKGHEAELLPVESFASENKPSLLKKIEQADMLGIGYPIHAFNAPLPLLQFAKMLPVFATEKRAFVIKTSGEPLKLNNASSLKLARLLRRKNCTITNEYHYCMPYNIIFRHSDAMAYKMWKFAEALVPTDADEILAGKRRLPRRVFGGGFVAWLLRCEQWGSKIVGRGYKTNENCVNCMKCVNDCPTHNITVVNGKIKFGKNCIMCMRCAHLCPKNAIRMGMFDKWKVNGAYSFAAAADDQPQKYNRMLTKAYERYFDECCRRLLGLDELGNDMLKLCDDDCPCEDSAGSAAKI